MKLAQRLGQLVDKLADKKVDDSYMTGHSIFYQQFSEKRRPLGDLVQHARPKLEKLTREPDSVHLGKMQIPRCSPQRRH